MRQIPTESLSPLASLVSLSLNFNVIEYVHEHAFSGLHSLLRLSLYGNRIQQLHELAFFGVGGNLTRINLGANLFESLPVASLRPLRLLRRLQLHENRIDQLPEVDSQSEPIVDHLDTLVLSSNRIRSVPARAFRLFGALSSLDLANNRLELVHPDAFDGIEGTLSTVLCLLSRVSSFHSSSFRIVGMGDFGGQSIDRSSDRGSSGSASIATT
jgi:Leucine-rich repeat (LRR) protein